MVNPATELAILKGIPIKQVKAKMGIYPVAAETKINYC